MTTETKERPILFNGEMVRAILAGRKTQTRRVVKPQPSHEAVSSRLLDRGWEFWGPIDSETGRGLLYQHSVPCPYGVPGDRLWVRETFVTGWETDCGEVHTEDEDGKPIPERAWYRADDDLTGWIDEDERHHDFENIPWKPSIHMPRWASRITLQVERVWVERVQEISADDITSEGVEDFPSRDFRTLAFMDLWDSINAKRGYSWDSNPWVWCVEFKRCES